MACNSSAKDRRNTSCNVIFLPGGGIVKGKAEVAPDKGHCLGSMARFAQVMGGGMR